MLSPFLPRNRPMNAGVIPAIMVLWFPCSSVLLTLQQFLIRLRQTPITYLERHSMRQIEHRRIAGPTSTGVRPCNTRESKGAKSGSPTRKQPRAHLKALAQVDKLVCLRLGPIPRAPLGGPHSSPQRLSLRRHSSAAFLSPSMMAALLSHSDSGGTQWTLPSEHQGPQAVAIGPSHEGSQWIPLQSGDTTFSSFKM